MITKILQRSPQRQSIWRHRALPHLVTVAIHECWKQPQMSYRRSLTTKDNNKALDSSPSPKMFMPFEVPNPMKDPVAAGRAGVPSSSICDPNNLLNVDTKNVIEGYLNDCKTQVTIQFIPYTVYNMLYTIHYTLYTIHYTLYTIH